MNIGLLGYGTIGTGVYELINLNKGKLSQNAPESVIITKILDKDSTKKVRDPVAKIVTDADDIINDPEIDIVIALCGGMDFEYQQIKRALTNGKHVVTANKAVISEYFSELIDLAQAHHVILRYEASVGGGIPIINGLTEALALNNIHEIKGIMNGTTNFILSKMTEEEADFEETLKLAQSIGFAEADPTADIGGYDVSRKLAILSSLAYGTIVKDEDIQKRPMSDVRAIDIKMIGQEGYVIKYLGHSILENNQTIYTTVEPVLFNEKSIMANVNSEFNNVSIQGDVIGELQFYGKGAGKEATANAVVSDVLKIMKAVKYQIPEVVPTFDKVLAKKGTSIFKGRYYLRVHVPNDAVINEVLTYISQLTDKKDILIEDQQLFVFTEVIHADDFDAMTENLKKNHYEFFYARIYN